MKAIFISYNKALSERVMETLDRLHARGFTRWEDIHGRGSFDGEPHYGNHAWPSVNVAVLTIVANNKVKPILDELRYIDHQAPQHGLRAFVWDITSEM